MKIHVLNLTNNIKTSNGKKKTYEKRSGRMSRKTDYIISLEATTEWPLTHFRALKNKELRVSDRGKVNAARSSGDDAQETPRACNAIFITRPRTCLGKNVKFMFPRPACPRRSPIYSRRNFYQRARGSA